MNLDNERKAFEDEFRKINSNIVFWLNTWDEEMQGYNHPTMCWIWNMWLASANREGYKLVPVEPTERMLDSAYSSILDNLHYADLENIYTAMIGACND
mgnify:CR=1 FL=1